MLFVLPLVTVTLRSDGATYPLSALKLTVYVPGASFADTPLP